MAMNHQLEPVTFVKIAWRAIFDGGERPTAKVVTLYLAIASVLAGLEWWALNQHYGSEFLGGPILGAWFVASTASLNYMLKRTPPVWSIAGVAALISTVDLVFFVIVAGSVSRMMAFFFPWIWARGFKNSNDVVVAMEFVFYFVLLVALAIAARGWSKYSSQAHIAQEAKLEVERERANVAERDRELVRAELAVLRAQIEPHFLWNTLAQVQYLTRKSPPDAEKMTGYLIRYLRAAVPQTHGSMTTLGSEVESVRAYLELMKIRMGSRLTATVEIEHGLDEVSFPPRLIQTLAENAIKHGIEPKVGPVTLTVTAAVKSDDVRRLVIEVIDNGVGLQAQPSTKGTGLGLRSVRERLRLLYGEDASLSVNGASHGGAVSRIEVPLTEQPETAPIPLADRRFHR